MSKKGREKINILLDIDNYFGEYKGRSAPIFIFLALAVAPCILYAMYFWVLIPIKWFVIAEILYCGRIWLITIGNEKKKKEIYIKQQRDEFESGKKMIRVSHIHDDGLIEYTNGAVAYIISGFPTTYFDENKLSIDLEEFFGKIDKFEFDIHAHNVVDESALRDNLECMQVYKDKEIIRERVAFYMDQDNYCRDNTTLYRYNFVIKTYKSNWKLLYTTLKQAVTSEAGRVFKTIKICDKRGVEDVMARDVCLFMSIQDMMQEKYKDDNILGSTVLYYGDDVPSKYKQKEEIVDLESRRVVEGED